MLLVTGGAGFIGSNMVASLNEAGRTDVVVNDVLGSTANGAIWPSASSPMSCRPPTCSAWLDGRKLDAVIHMGAISDTTATDGDLVIETNFRLSLRLLDWCTATQHAVHLRLVGRDLRRRRRTASTTTGRPQALRRLRPMNLYGWSKHLFDLAVVDRAGAAARSCRRNGRASSSSTCSGRTSTTRAR